MVKYLADALNLTDSFSMAKWIYRHAHKLKHKNEQQLVRCEMNTKKGQSHVLVLGLDEGGMKCE